MIITTVTTVAQVSPGLKVTITVWFTGNKLVWSPQKPNTNGAPLCSKLTDVTCTVPFTLTCTELTVPWNVDVPKVARMKTSPQAVAYRSDRAMSTARRRRCTTHPHRQVYT